MKIAVYIQDIPIQAGGAYSFLNSIIYGLKNVNINHSIYIFTDNYTGLTHVNEFEVIYLNKYKIEVFHKKKNLFDWLKKVYVKIIDYFLNYRLFNVSRKVIDLCDKVNDLSVKFNYFNNYEYKISKAIEEFNIELVWFPTPCYVSVKIPYICTVWDLAHRKWPFFPEVSFGDAPWEDRENFYRATLPKAAYIITGTKEGVGEISKFYNIDFNRIKIVPFPIPSFIDLDRERINSFSSFNLECDFVFYPAQFWAHKNHVVILEALTILKKQNIILNAIFTGSDKGNLNYIKKYTKDLGLDDQICFAGFLNSDDMQLLYEKAKMLVFPTFFGPDNLPPLEAFAFGCPVIASMIEGAEEQLADAALYFNPCDEIELSQKICEILFNDELRLSLIQNGKKQIEEKTPENYIKQINSIFNEFEKYRRTWE